MSDRLEALTEYARGFARNAAGRKDNQALVKFALRLQVLTDQEISEGQKGSARAPVCKLGCDACCHRLVEATLPEVIAIAQHVRDRFSPQERQGFSGRLRDASIANAPFWNDELAHPATACPFLVEGACSIYSVRPVSCRALNSFDASVCERKFVEGEEVVRPTLPPQDAVAELIDDVIAGCKEGGIRSGAFELAPTVDLILSDPDSLKLEGDWAPIERFKLKSEFLSENETAPKSVFDTLENPFNVELVELRLKGEVQQIWDRTDPHTSVPLQALLRLSLPPAYATSDEVELWWRRFGDTLDILESSRLEPREAFDVVQLIDTFALAYSGKDVKPHLERFLRVLHAWALESLPHLSQPIESARKPGKFRLGYISPDIRGFNGSRWALGWLIRHSNEIETHVINLCPHEDNVSLAFRRHADYYFHAPFLVTDVAAMTRGLDLDALFFTDIGMSGSSVQLSALRLARRQFNCWGHPVTSGSPTMDHFLTASLMQPPDGQSHFTESLVGLPGTGVSLPNRSLRPSSKSHAELGVPESGYLLFCQTAFKQQPSWDYLFEAIAMRSKKPIVFLEGHQPVPTRLLRERLGKQGMNTIFLPFQEMPDYLRILQLADASLDTPSFSGGITTLDALAVGTPVITLPGEFMRGRLSSAFLQQAAASGLIAKDAQDYIELALDPARCREIMSGAQVENLYEDPSPVEAIDKVLLAGG